MIINLIIGIVAGFMSGLIGIGGGILIVPALIYFSKMSQLQAQGTSIALLLLPLGILAFITYYRAGYINFSVAGIIAVTFIIGAFLGSKVAVNIDQALLTKIFAVVLFLISIKLFFFPK